MCVCRYSLLQVKILRFQWIPPMKSMGGWIQFFPKHLDVLHLRFLNQQLFCWKGLCRGSPIATNFTRFQEHMTWWHPFNRSEYILVIFGCYLVSKGVARIPCIATHIIWLNHAHRICIPSRYTHTYIYNNICINRPGLASTSTESQANTPQGIHSI